MLATAGQLDPQVSGRSFLLGAIPSVPRRTLYSFIERERSLPGFRNFDLADPEQHTPRRHLTTVPQQALFMMNSSFVAEQARHVVHRLKTETDEPPEQRVQAIYGRLFGRRATQREVKLAFSFISNTESTMTEAQLQQQEPPPSSAWRYGFGELDVAAGRVKSFVPFEYFAPLLSVGFNEGLLDAWKPSSVLPDVEAGDVHLTAKGGAPGDDPRRSVIRRWVSPVDGKVNISGTLNHDIDQFAERFNPSNGIRAWIVSNRVDTLASWTLRDLEASTELSRLSVERGRCSTSSWIHATIMRGTLSRGLQSLKRRPRKTRPRLGRSSADGALRKTFADRPRHLSAHGSNTFRSCSKPTNSCFWTDPT